MENKYIRKDGKMVFVILTLFAIVSVVYCCDFNALKGFEFLINQKDSMWYGVGLSIIASYIFYVIQVWIPEQQKRRKAESILVPHIKDYLENVYEIVKIVESVCNISKEKGRIHLQCNYIRVEKSDWKNIYVEKIDLENYEKINNLLKEKIEKSEHFKHLSNREIDCLEKLFSNNFIRYWNRNRMSPQQEYIDGEIIKRFENEKRYIAEARKIYKEKYWLNIVKYDENEMINLLEWQIKRCQNIKVLGIARMNIGKK